MRDITVEHHKLLRITIRINMNQLINLNLMITMIVKPQHKKIDLIKY
jgi:hypothetical protein